MIFIFFTFCLKQTSCKPSCRIRQQLSIPLAGQIQISTRSSFCPSSCLPRRRKYPDLPPSPGSGTRRSGTCTFGPGTGLRLSHRFRARRCRWFMFLCALECGWTARTWKCRSPLPENRRKSTQLAVVQSRENWLLQWRGMRAMLRKRLQSIKHMYRPFQWSDPFGCSLRMSLSLLGWPFKSANTCPPVTLQVRNIPAYRNAEIRMSFPWELTIPYEKIKVPRNSNINNFE